MKETEVHSVGPLAVHGGLLAERCRAAAMHNPCQCCSSLRQAGRREAAAVMSTELLSATHHLA